MTVKDPQDPKHTSTSWQNYINCKLGEKPRVKTSICCVCSLETWHYHYHNGLCRQRKKGQERESTSIFYRKQHKRLLQSHFLTMCFTITFFSLVALYPPAKIYCRQRVTFYPRVIILDVTCLLCGSTAGVGQTIVPESKTEKRMQMTFLWLNNCWLTLVFWPWMATTITTITVHLWEE